ncbi:MAG: ABC transporter permease [Tannerellaceae bacterium]|nr:ABC transporter permease [Tannerellaceae bacterium]
MKHLLNLKSFFKFLGKNKSYTFIDIFGLSISLMFVILIATYTFQELSTDQFHENKDRIYVLASEDNYATAYRLSDRLLERYPEIDKICGICNQLGATPVEIGDYEIKSELLLVDTTFFDMFSFELIQGNQKNALEALNYAVISETYARKAFPDRDPMGQILKFSNGLSLTVNGVMKDIKNSTVSYGDVLFRMENVKYFNPGIESQEYHNAGATVLFIMTKPGMDLNTRVQEITAYFKEIFWMYQRDIRKQVQFVPLTDVYFSKLDSWGRVEQGDWTFVLVLMSVGILILLFAIINYVNLTVAQTGFRAKEMAIRRLLGSSRMELFARLILEATFLTFVSFIVGLFLAYLFIPSTNNLLQTKLAITTLISPFSIVIVISVLLIMGLVAGFITGDYYLKY